MSLITSSQRSIIIRLPVLVKILHRYDSSLFLQIVDEKLSNRTVIKFSRIFLGNNPQRFAKRVGFNYGAWLAEFVGRGIDKQFSES